MLRSAPLLLSATLLFSAATASAQTTFRLGLRGGANRAITTLDPASNSTGSYPFSYGADKSAIYAWQAGIVLEARRGNFALQPALLFSQKGDHLTAYNSISGVAGYSTQELRSTNRYNWLELPLNVVYTLHGDHGLQVFAGPYVALGVGGRQRGTITYSSYYGPAYDPIPYQSQVVDRPVSYNSDSASHRWDAGVNFGLGYRQGPVQVQLSYGLGLRNLHQSPPAFINPAVSTAYNRVLQLTGTYFFSW